MPVLLLALSLILLLVSLALSILPLFTFAIVNVLVSLAALRLRSRWLLGSFWIWLNLVLWHLCTRTVPDPREAAGVGLLLGLPEPAFWMLFGIWVFPVLLWPLGFALAFRRWIRP